MWNKADTRPPYQYNDDEDTESLKDTIKKEAQETFYQELTQGKWLENTEKVQKHPTVRIFDSKIGNLEKKKEE